MTHMQLSKFGAALLVTTVMTGPIAAARAQQEGHTNLPEAETLLDRNVEATGGAAAHRAVKARKRTGKLAVDMAGHQFEAQAVEHALAPASTHRLLDGAAFSQVTVTDGRHAWEWRPQTRNHGETGETESTTRLLEGADKERVLEKARLHAALDWREIYESVHTAGEGEVSGRAAYEVRAKTKSGEEFSLFYDQENGRLVKRTRTVDFHSMGATRMEIFLEDYTCIGEIWEPMIVRVVLDSANFGKGTQIWTYSKIEHNVKIPTSMFELPEELKQDLVGRAEEAAQGE